jgi:hypothetical protein
MMKTENFVSVYHEAPAGVKVLKAFSLEEALCQGKTEQSHILPNDAWVFLGIIGFYRSVEKAEAAWPILQIEIWLDGKPVAAPKDYTTGPYSFSILCANRKLDGFIVETSIFVPPLPVGMHEVVWKLKAESDIDDGWDFIPAGVSWKVSSNLSVINKPYSES